MPLFQTVDRVARVGDLQLLQTHQRGAESREARSEIRRLYGRVVSVLFRSGRQLGQPRLRHFVQIFMGYEKIYGLRLC